MYCSSAFIISINVDLINLFFSLNENEILFSVVFHRSREWGSLKRADNKSVTPNHTLAATTKVPGNGGGTDPASLINYVFFIIVIGAYMYVQL